MRESAFIRLATAARQRGVALITVLLVFAVVAVIAAEMVRRSQLNLRSVANLVDSRQAYYYALSGESMARQVLSLDVRKGGKTKDKDSLTEDWARLGEQQPFEIEHGSIKVEIHDLQGRFNLNSVVDEKGVAIGKAVERLGRLFAAIGVNPSYAARWVDWVDANQTALSSGAEDAAYPDYRTAGAWEADISALRLLREMTPEDYAKIAPHVTVLPEATPVNINTADRQVLRALDLGGQVSAIQAKQQQGGYAAVSDLGLSEDPKDLSVKSSYFEVITTVKYLDREQRLRSVLQRDENGAITVRSRSRQPVFDTDSDLKSDNY